MNWAEFEDWSIEIARWSRRYRENIRARPVRPDIQPGDIRKQIAAEAPELAQPMAEIFDDFEQKIMPGMTHWQHPRFFAYFPANAAPASVLAEQLATTIAAQCMLWQTSPAATELETRMMEWLRAAIGISCDFHGVIQDSASTATLAAVLMMREQALQFTGNTHGLSAGPAPRVYASGGVHSSIDRAIWISGIGESNLVRIRQHGPLGAMDCEALEAAIVADISAGHRPAGIIISVGGTAYGATDDVAAVIDVARRHELFTHVDAAWAGSAMICEELRGYWTGVDGADSLVFNPHKWLGAQFDCSAHFVRNPEILLKTLAIHPEYLKTHGKTGITDYSEWSIPLGRRFRALKLWFLLRSEGMENLRQMIRNHVAWSERLAGRLDATPGFEIVTPPMLSLFTFRFVPPGTTAPATAELLEKINDDGRIYLTQTKIDDETVIRFQAGQFEMTADDAETAYDVICEIAGRMA